MIYDTMHTNLQILIDNGITIQRYEKFNYS